MLIDGSKTNLSKELNSSGWDKLKQTFYNVVLYSQKLRVRPVTSDKENEVSIVACFEDYPRASIKDANSEFPTCRYK